MLTSVIQDPIRDPIQDPIQDSIRDPIQDPIQDPIRDLKAHLLTSDLCIVLPGLFLVFITKFTFCHYSDIYFWG